MLTTTMPTFEELVNKYSALAEPMHVAVGLRPSGRIHLGNIATLGISGLLARNVGPHLADVHVTVCDLDLPDITDWKARETGYVKYFRSLPAPVKGYENLLEYAVEGIQNFVNEIRERTGVDFSLRMLSDTQRDPQFRAGLKRVLDTPGMANELDRRIPEGRTAVYPICPSCYTSNPTFATYHEGIMDTTCSNPECPVNEFSMHIEDTSRDIAVHYLIDPLRDALVEPLIHVHVFGGDYSDKHCRDETKVQKINRITRIASGGKAPEFLIGPTLYARDGTKMSKSQNNGLTLDVLRDHFGNDYVERVLDFVELLVTRRVSHVDYSIVQDDLLSRKQ
jgi:lysyl-tRNA synthetase class I